MKKVSNYEKRGVSSGKEDVHRAVDKLDRGIYPTAFCKILPDYWGGRRKLLYYHALGWSRN